ncbi:GLABROUS1 enhancer-binding protein-like [Hirschfeldia incana]|nr:GLABROUS1 enhancer-binding protein-like [Hirschfeldia incana]
MAPKDKIENPPAASSSEEEEESGSSGEESGSSDSEAGDIQSKLTQKPPPPATKKPESDSEEDESESDSDSEPPTKTKPLNTVASKPKPETSGSIAPSLPESSTAKRSLKQQADDEPKKKAKTSTTTENAKKKKDEDVIIKKISGEDAKKMFQRLFSETDEIALLQGFLDFTSTRGDPYENMDAFCDYVKTLIDFNASKAQIVTKLQRCKKKFVNIVKNALKKGKTEDKVTCSKDLDQKSFDLSRKIWGVNGVLPAKPRNKSNKEVAKSPPSPKKEVEVVEKRKGNVVVVDAQRSSSGEVAMFFKAANVSVFGLDESTVSAVWDMVEDGGKKKEVEEKLKKLKAMQVELCLQRTALLDTTAKVIFKDKASSSSS